MNKKRLLMISTDRKILEEGSAVRERQIGYAKGFEEVHIIVFSKKHEIQNEVVLSENCWAYSTQSRSKFFYSLDAIRLGRFIMKGRNITDITCQDPFQTAMAGVSLKKQFPQAELEIQVHTDIGSAGFVSPKLGFAMMMGNKVRKILAGSYLQRADHVRVVSEKIKQFLIQDSRLKIQEDRIDVRPVAVDVGWIKDAPILTGTDLHAKYPQFDTIVLMASRLEKEKNIELAIEAWKLVIEKHPKAGLVIIGEGSEGKKLKVASEKLKVDRSIAFEPWADKAALASYYKTADAFLSVSLYEGYGMTFVEARAAGCPVISTDVGIAREIGATIVENDVQSVASGIIGIIG